MVRQCLTALVCGIISAGAAGFSEEPDKRAERGVQVLRELISRPATEEGRRENIREVLASLNNLRQPPVRATYDFFEVPGEFAARLRSGVGHGTVEASNLQPHAGQDAGVADPLPSSFWVRPARIGELDLYHGFGRTAAEGFGETIWSYAGPKRGTGMNPGFNAKAGGVKIRVKFGETKSEPFAARIFWALGYNVDATDYCDGLKVRYNRRLFEEFNSREEVKTQFRFLYVLPLYTLKMQKRFDPFDYVAWAVMKDGRRVDGARLKGELIESGGKGQGAGVKGEDALRFRSKVEEQIDYLVTVPANVQIRDKHAESVGPWAFEGLGHEDRRELRSVALLAAWIGWYDCRQQNTRLRVLQQSGAPPRLLHYFSDLGAGLGKSDGVFSGRGELPNEFSWTFTTASKWQGPGRMRIPFRIIGYRPMEPNEAFERMTVEDARWMARLIGQLTEQQLVAALAASGFDSAEVKLYSEKLISRRDGMISDLGLSREVAFFRPNGVNQHFNYDPEKDGPVALDAKHGGLWIVPFSLGRIVSGRLERSPDRATLELRASNQ